MIPANAIASQLQAYIRPTETPLIQVVDAVQDIQRLFSIGEQVRALVTGMLPSGRFSVMVKDQLLDLNLPRNTEPGEEFDMQVLSNSPRLVFLLSREAAVPEVAAQKAGTSSAPVVLSNAARFLANLLNEAGDGDPDIQTSAAGRALLASASATPDTAKLAQVLQSVLGESGLFYESHLAQWLKGERSLAQLQQEPQAVLHERSARENAELRQSSSEARQALLGRSLLAALPLDDAEAAAQAEASPDWPDGQLEQMPQATRQLVQQQLQMLDQRPFVWQGEAWPGQPLRWEVDEDGQNGAAEFDGEGERIWRSRLALDLPHLGHVEVNISLSNKTRVEVGFRVLNPATAQQLLDAQPTLQMRLDAAGLELRANHVAVAEQGE